MAHEHLELIGGTATGTALSVSLLPTTTDIGHTIVLAAIGAVVGFVTTLNSDVQTLTTSSNQ